MAAAARPAAQGRSDAMPKLVAEGLFKVFGDRPQAALDALADGQDKQTILERTGQVVAVQDASFCVDRGEVFVVMGLSGSGKSTLVRLLNRLIEPSAGHVRVDGADIMAMDRRSLVALRRRDIAMVFQSFALMPHLTALDNAAFGLDVAGRSRTDRHDRARAALDTVGLSDYAGSYPDELSGGMQQRVGLARALALEPTIMLMDEAFSALDPLIRLDMQDELLRIKAARDLTVLFITHDLDEALRLGDRLAIMDDGRVVQTGRPQDIVAEPANDYVRAFFGLADMGKVFTAADLARIEPSGTVRCPPYDAATALALLERTGRHHAVVHNRAGRFEGVVSRDRLRRVRRRPGIGFDAAFIPNPPILAADTRLEACLGTVARVPFDLPVVDADRHFLGTVNRTRVLLALDRRETRNGH
ncbi:glycine betaine/L-proline ABC transporter ATP-binding protein ProV [Rhodothalassium salexigens]|uniref:glycine betaine/L-proline ABC transporter ATP-binding protein ProV n=2 Tax=Rhodothalassium salexigens TaxID=1086 RepID=UPI001F5C84EE|nr:glycine betaine/L-proline ABC transporter ATP-binding protein ProV [Rhodothalassium salexigens]